MTPKQKAARALHAPSYNSGIALCYRRDTARCVFVALSSSRHRSVTVTIDGYAQVSDGSQSVTMLVTQDRATAP
jgi:hypothetical protein